MTSLWRIYCTDAGDTGWQEIWSNTAPTTCPNDIGHTVNSDSIQHIAREVEVLRISGMDTKELQTEYMTRFVQFQYDTDILGPIRRIKVIARGTDGVTSFDLQVYDITNLISLVDTTETNTEPDVVIDMGAIITPPSGSVIIEVSGKRNTSSGSVFMDEVVVFAREI